MDGLQSRTPRSRSQALRAAIKALSGARPESLNSEVGTDDSEKRSRVANRGFGSRICDMVGKPTTSY